MDLVVECLDPATVCSLLKSCVKKHGIPVSSEAASQFTRAVGSGSDECLQAVRAIIQTMTREDSILLCGLMHLYEMVGLSFCIQLLVHASAADAHNLPAYVCVCACVRVRVRVRASGGARARARARACTSAHQRSSQLCQT